MAVSIHLISVPTEEVVTSRVVYLPEQGGTFGRAPSCDISLPDQTKRISRTHGEIKLTDHGYTIKSTGQNNAQLNDKTIIKDKEYPLSDGDIVKVENYTMLVSTLTQSDSSPTSKIEEDMFSQPFELNLNDDDTEFLDESTPQEAPSTESSFSHKNVLSDDPFASDPFEDLDEEVVAEHLEVDEVEQTLYHQGSDLEYLPVEAQQNPQIEASIAKLISMTEKNQQYLQNPMLQHDALFAALEETVDQFLNEFAPTQLENQFSEYISGGMFTSKDKKYWKIYRKHFQHRQENGDFRRQFKALFMENMQKQREEG
ncbi:FHA domain-containing protein [Vibrio sinaloensis]|uniref:FHA domain-containing protein n=1 Tax=Photobacterium sp. (strain ATCC 43367) TaxID=379097 RepID=UPI0035EBE473